MCLKIYEFMSVCFCIVGAYAGPLVFVYLCSVVSAVYIQYISVYICISIIWLSLSVLLKVYSIRCTLYLSESLPPLQSSKLQWAPANKLLYVFRCNCNC